MGDFHLSPACAMNPPPVTPNRLEMEARAGTRSRQQRRSSPQGAQEEDAARGRLPRDEAPPQLRKAVRTPGPRKGRGGAARPQARAQASRTRGFLAPARVAAEG